MYLQFYQLNRAPFKSSADPDVLWAGNNYQKALEALKYGLTHHSGLSLFTGNPGSGKTTVIQAVLRALEQTVLAAVIPDSSLTVQEFYDLVAHSLALSGQIDNRLTFHEHIRVLLQQAAKQKKQVLLVVDEAQQLSAELIEEIDALLNLHSEESVGLNICLVGQVDKASGLGGQVIQAFENHVMVRYHLDPFTVDETEGYIRLRLQVAGADRDIFNDGAIQAVHRYSKGYPGQINIICDLALFSGFKKKCPEITAEIIRASAEKLQFPTVGGLNDAVKKSSPVVPLTSSPRRKWSKFNDTRKGGEESSVSPTTDEMVGLERVKGGDEANPTKSAKQSFVVPAVTLLMTLMVAGGSYVFYNKRRDGGVPVTIPVTQTAAVQATSGGLTTPMESDSSDNGQVELSVPGIPEPDQSPDRGEQPVLSTMGIIHKSERGAVPVNNNLIHDAKKAGQADLTVKQPVPQGQVEVKELLVEESASSIFIGVEPLIKPERKEPAVSEAASLNKQPIHESVSVVASPKSNAMGTADIDKQVVQATTLAEEPVAQSGTVAITGERVNEGQTESNVSLSPIVNQDRAIADQSETTKEQEMADSSASGKLFKTDSASLDSTTGVEKGTEGVVGDEPKVTYSIPAAVQEKEFAVDALAGEDVQEKLDSPIPATLTEEGDLVVGRTLGAGTVQEEFDAIEPSGSGPLPSSNQDYRALANTKAMHDEQQTTSADAPVQPRKAKLQEFLGGGSFVEPEVSVSEKIQKKQIRMQPTGSPGQQEKIEIKPEIDPVPDPSEAIDWVLKKRDKQNLSAP